MAPSLGVSPLPCSPGARETGGERELGGRGLESEAWGLPSCPALGPVCVYKRKEKCDVAVS